MKLRILESDWTRFADALRERRDVETAGFILAERLAGATRCWPAASRSFPTTGISFGAIISASIQSRSTGRSGRPATRACRCSRSTRIPTRAKRGSRNQMTAAMRG